jgi:hypothetical protein
VEYAWAPQPVDGATDVPRDVELSWKSGNFATHHDVYFGTSWDDVNDANTSNPLGVYEGRQLLADTNDDPCALELGQRYYWRIDEVNEANNPDDIWKGKVWQFTVANFILVDDFESYDDYDENNNPIDGTWDDLGLGYTSLGAEPDQPVNGGSQSMWHNYNNSIPFGGVYWSATKMSFGGATDLTYGGQTEALALYFYGLTTNDANDTEELYVALEGSYAEVRYSDDHGNDNNDLRLAEWIQWNIALSEFGGVDPSAATGMQIGFGDSTNNTTAGGEGHVFIDDIRLYPSRCVPQRRPFAEDLSGPYDEKDCIINYYDVRAMAAQWQRGDLDLTPVTNPGDANLVGHWELDDGDGNTATDSSDSNYHGTAKGDYDWTTGKIGSGAIDLSGGWVVVEDEGNTPKLRTESQVSVMAWINLAGSEDYRVVIKGENNEETFGLEVDNDDGLAFIFRDVNSPNDSVKVASGDPLSRGEWIHVAGTYDANEQTCYVNGIDANSETRGALEILTDANDGMAIGGRYGDDSDRFDGEIDDVRVYDRGLTRAEVGYIASQSTGEVLLDSEANLYSGESPEVINIRDAAVLLDSWLIEKLWPE